jgi:hypothetical protein
VKQYDKFSLQNIKNITIIMMMLMLPVLMMMRATMMSYSIVAQPSSRPKGEYETNNGH